MWTKPLRKLTPETSLGFDVIAFADWIRDRLEELAEQRDEPELLDMLPRLLEWQRWLFIHALELLPGPALIFRFRTVLLLVARQNGKTTLLVYLALWRMYQDGAKTTIGTAQSVDIAEDAWTKAVEVAETIPELYEEIDKIKAGKGSQLLKLDGGQRYKIAAANRRGARGLSGDLIFFDELREHQTWNAWSATSNTSLARSRAQIWGVSNAGDAASVVLKHLREVAIAQIMGETPVDMPKDLDIEGYEIGLFEWSAQDGERGTTRRGIWDREGWAEANPSLGVTITESAIAAAAAAPEWEFRTEVLCQFVNTAGAGPFPNGSWAATSVPTVKRDKSREAAYCLDMSHNRQWVYVGIAWWDTEGRMRVELAARLNSPSEAVKWLKSKKRKIKPDHVTLQARGAPVSSMTKDLEKAGIPFVPWEGQLLASWHGVFYDLVRVAVDDDRDPDAPLLLTHGAQPPLDVAATSAAIHAIADGWVIDRKNSENDAAPLMAAIGAVGLLSTDPAPRLPSIYETSDLMVV